MLRGSVATLGEAMRAAARHALRDHRVHALARYALVPFSTAVVGREAEKRSPPTCSAAPMASAPRAGAYG